MGELYIGGQRAKSKSGGIMWKLLLFLFFFLLLAGAALKVSAPFIAETWLNNHGSGKLGYAYSVREVELSLKEGEVTLKDVKVFNPKTKEALLESASVELKMNLADVLSGSERKITMSANRLDVFLSEDLSSEISRMTSLEGGADLYFSLIEAKFDQVNIIEKKTDISRRLVVLSDIQLNLSELSVSSVNKNSKFTLASKLSTGGEMNLSGMVNVEEGKSFWKIEGSLHEFSPDLFNRLAGSELPFSFNEPVLNAQITAQTSKGEIKGEIIPEVSRLNLIEEKPGFTRQVIARALTDELTFSLPFTLNDEMTLEYADTFKKLKEYRKYPLSYVSSRS